MEKVILICGKISCGKTHYAKELQNQYNAVILSVDEASYDLINNEQGEFYNVFVEKLKLYLRKKAVEIVKANSNVILDWGFWSFKERKEISEYFKTNNIAYEWHYIDIAPSLWQEYINKRNNAIRLGMNKEDFYVDEGLLKKLNGLFEIPKQEEIDVWYKLMK